MATHSSVLAWRIPGTAEPSRLLSMGSHRVGHDWSDLAAAAVSKNSINHSVELPVSNPIKFCVPEKFLLHCETTFCTQSRRKSVMWLRDAWTILSHPKQCLPSTLKWMHTHHMPTFFTFLPFFFWRRQWHPTPVLLPGKSHGRRSLVGCSPHGREESDTTEWLCFHFSLSCIGVGNGNPLQCSCLENPRDGGSW